MRAVAYTHQAKTPTDDRLRTNSGNLRLAVMRYVTDACMMSFVKGSPYGSGDFLKGRSREFLHDCRVAYREHKKILSLAHLGCFLQGFRDHDLPLG